MDAGFGTEPDLNVKRLLDIPPDFATREVARARIRGIHEVIGVDVDVGVSGLHRGDQLRKAERLAVVWEGIDHIRGGDRALCQHAVKPTRNGGSGRCGRV